MESAVLEEWKQLRTEIAQKQAFVQRILVTTGGANFAIIVFGMRDSGIEGIAICLLPTILTSVVYLWLLTQVYSGFRIAAYIRTELEPKIPGLNWENWLSANANKYKFRFKNVYSLLAIASYCISLFAALTKIVVLHLDHNLNHSVLEFSVTTTIVWILWILGTHLFVINKVLEDLQNIHRRIDGD